jgi:hypothetical protein
MLRKQESTMGFGTLISPFHAEVCSEANRAGCSV